MERSVEVRVFLIAPNIPPVHWVVFCYDNGIIALDIKKVPTLMTKLNQEKKLSIGTRNINGFNWDRFPPSEKRGKFDAPMKNPDTPNILFFRIW